MIKMIKKIKNFSLYNNNLLTEERLQYIMDYYYKYFKNIIKFNKTINEGRENQFS